MSNCLHMCPRLFSASPDLPLRIGTASPQPHQGYALVLSPSPAPVYMAALSRPNLSVGTTAGPVRFGTPVPVDSGGGIADSSTSVDYGAGPVDIAVCLWR